MLFAYLTTFYSYKGGVGRTLAMANVGAVLAQRGDGRVLLIDCDLEAPGLHRVPGLTPPKALQGGLLPWLAQLEPHTPEDPSHDALWQDALYAPRQDLALDVLVACHGDEAPRYYNQIDWPRWFAFRDPVTKVSPLLQALRRMLVLLQGRGYAHVLIDSRTGFSDLGGLMLFQLPHMAVVVSNYNEQNLGGLKPVLKAMLPYTDPEQAGKHGEMRGYFPPPAGTPADAHQLGILERWLVFSPVPGSHPELEPLREQRQARARVLLGSDYAQGGYTEIPSYAAFQLQESLAVLEAPDGELAKSYQYIALKIEANRGERLRALDADVARRSGVDTGVPTIRQGPSTTAKGRSFEQKVAELLRLLGYEVQGETRVEGKKVDLIATGGRLRKEHYVVECKDQKAAISNSQVIELWRSAETAKQKIPHAGGIFVTSGDYSPDARAIGEAKGLLLYTLAELEREIFNPEPYAHAWQQAYEGKREAQSYVTQQLFIDSGDKTARKQGAHRGAAPDATLPDLQLDDMDPAGLDLDVDTQDSAERIDLIPYALAWLGVGTHPGPLPNRFWLLLGNYGTGKSTFTRRLTFELLRRRRVGEVAPLPILINLKERAGAPNLDDLLQAFLREYRLDASLQQLRYGLEQGRAVLLLDSFDEMALAQYGRTLDQQLREFGRLLQDYPDARVLLTSRTHLFKSERDLDRQVRGSDSLAQPGSALAGTARELGATVQTLAPFTPAQIGAFIRLHAPQRAEAIERFIAQTHKLSELAPTAVLLEMIISGYDALRQRAAKDEIRAAELYQVFVDEWLGSRAHRHAELETEQRKQWLEVLARLLWDTPGQRLHYQHLYEQIQSRRALSAALDPARVDLELRTASFLTRNSAGDYGFSHRSFLEFFLARALLRALQATQGEAPEAAVQRLLPALPDTRLSPECLRFLRDLAALCGADARAVATFWRHVATVLRQLLQAPRPPAQSANALRIVRDCLPDPAEGIPEGAELAGADLSGESWALPLRGANLRGADLRSSRFFIGDEADSDLTGATLAEALVARTLFIRTQMSGVNASRIQGEGTVFRSANCQKAIFSEAKIRSADFSNANLEDADFSRTESSNSRFRDSKRAGANWDRSTLIGVPLSEWPEMPIPTSINQPRELIASAASSRNTAISRLSDRHLLVAQSTGNMEVWDTVYGQLTALLIGHRRPVNAICVFPSGKIASCSDEHTIRLWDKNGNCTAELHGHDGPVQTLCALTEDSFASGSDDASIRIWNTDGQSIGILKDKQGEESPRVFALCKLPSNHLASGYSDGTIRIWSPDRKLISTINGHQGSVHSLCSLANRLLASGSIDNTIRLWDNNGVCSAVLKEHQFSVRALCNLSNGNFASGSNDRTIRIWDAEGNQAAVLHGHKNGVRSICELKPDLLASCSLDGTTRIWDHSGHCKAELTKPKVVINRLCTLSDGLIASSSSDDIVRVWNQTSNNISVTKCNYSITSLCALPLGRLIVGSRDQSVRIMDHSGCCLSILQGHQDWVCAVAMLPNGDIASGSDDCTVRIWDSSGSCKFVLDAHQDWVRALCTLPQNTIISGSNDGKIRIWDSEGQCKAVLSDTGTEITSLCTLTPSLFASGSQNGTIAILKSNGHCGRIISAHEQRINTLCALPGDRLASGSTDQFVRLWEAATGQCTHLIHLAASIEALATQGHLLIAGLASGEILYFDIRPAALAASNTLRQVLSVRFHADEHILVYPDGAFWWPERSDGLLPELADHTWFRLLDRPLTDPDAAFPASAIAHERLPKPRTLKQILGPVPRRARTRVRRS